MSSVASVWHAACNFYPMIENATSLNAPTIVPDAGYKSWQGAARKTVMRMDPESRTAGPTPTFGRMVHSNVATTQSYAPAGDTKSNGTPDISYEVTESDDTYTFGDVIDMINPLQHLPVIGTLYRKFTGDTIKPMSDIIGGAIFGGPVGAVASTANVVIKSTTGKDIAENAFALAGFDVTPKKTKPIIAYDKAASLTAQNNLSSANNIVVASAADAIHMTADGRRNFSARNVPTQSWNA